jgi:hypothetical protein
MTPTTCWTIGPDETWHMDDMAIDCDSGAHVGFMAFAVVCIVAYPIGIPLLFLFLLYRNEKKSNAVHPEEDTAAPAAPSSGSPAPRYKVSRIAPVVICLVMFMYHCMFTLENQ